MKSRNSKFTLMTGFMGLTSFFVTACSDKDTAQEPKKIENGISFAVSDVQDMSEPSLPMTKAASVYETTSTPLEGDGAEGLELVETTIEGVDPVYVPASTRGTLITKDNFVTIDKPFFVFACKNGGSTADYLYKETVNADGTMASGAQWNKSEAASLKFYAVHPAVSNANQSITTTSGTNPIVKFIPNADAKEQTDLLVATTENFNYDDYVNQSIPIKFSHATTAIQFKVGNDLSYNRQVKTIEIKGVIGEGTYDVANKSWTLGSAKKDYSLTFTTPFSTAQNPGTIMNGGDGLFFMIPQTIPADATVKITFDNDHYVVAKIGGGGKAWVEGTTKTYMISNSRDISDREFTLSVKPEQLEKEYNQTDVAYTVQSYRRPMGYPAGKTDRDIKEPWTVTKYEYSDDGGQTWTTSTSKPAMVTANKESGDGSTSGEAATMTLANDFKDFKADREKELREAQEATGPLDLSMVNGKQETANCYIVSAGGNYKFPLIYGNATTQKTATYKPTKPANVSENSFITPYYHGTDEATDRFGKVIDDGKITKPEIEKEDGVKVLWNSEPNLVSNARIKNGYVEFSVDRKKIKEASAIIAVTRGNTDRNVLWSWHIWITSKDVVDTDKGYFMREPLGFRHTKWQGTTYQQPRKVRITVTQTRSKKVASFVITQKHSPLVREGVAMYYQQGRKDPLYPSSDFTVQQRGFNSGLVLLHSANYPMKMAMPRRYSEKNTNLGNWDWCWNPDRDQVYFNLWDANNSKKGQSTGEFVKTVYDPSPAGFRVPRLAEFAILNSGNNGKAAFTPALGRIDHDHFTLENTLNGYGYYWTSEKIEGPGRIGGTETDQQFYGYYGLVGLAYKDGNSMKMELKRKDLLDGRDSPMFINSAWACSVIPIKQ